MILVFYFSYSINRNIYLGYGRYWEDVPDELKLNSADGEFFHIFSPHNRNTEGDVWFYILDDPDGPIIYVTRPDGPHERVVISGWTPIEP